MKYKILILLLLFTLSNTSGQNVDRTYLAHDHNYGPSYTYGITEITIHSDSTYTRKNWNVGNKKVWKTYKEYKPEISQGKITQNGDYYMLTEYWNGNKTDFNWTVKFNDRRLNFYYKNKNKKLRIGNKYKRI